jgi:hypothetical protein
LLGAEPPEDVVAATTPAERMAMAWALSVEAWAVAGKSLPDYERGKAPVHLWRHGERPPDDDQ